MLSPMATLLNRLRACKPSQDLAVTHKYFVSNTVKIEDKRIEKQSAGHKVIILL
jgi:hypothetical protein